MDRKLQLLDRKGLFTSLKGTRRAIDVLLPTVRAARNEVVRGLYLKRISDRTGVPVETLERETASVVEQPRTFNEVHQQRRREERERGPRYQADLSGRYEPRPRPAMRVRMGAERNLLMMMFNAERWVEECAKFVGPDDFQDPDYRRLFRVLIETEGRRDPEGRWLLEFPEDLAGDVESIRHDTEHHDWTGATAFFAENMDRILARPMERQFREIKQDAPSDGEVDEDILERMKDQLAFKRENKHLKMRHGILDPNDPILRERR
jgi:DNA primase